MSAFISLNHAARLLSGNSPADFAFWQALLIEQAEALHTVKTWTETSSTLPPGGVSYWRSPDEWRIPFGRLTTWCAERGYQLPTEDKQAVPDDGQGNAQGGRRASQIHRILEVIQAMGMDAMSLPTGEKQRIKAQCLTDRRLFSESAFDRAWQAAVNSRCLRMENHDTFARR